MARDNQISKEFAIQMLHDLRTPLAKARTLSKLMRADDPEEMKDSIHLLKESLDEMEKTLQRLADLI